MSSSPRTVSVCVELDLRLDTGSAFIAKRTVDRFAEIFHAIGEPNFNKPTGDQRSGNVLRVSSLVAGGVPRQLQIGMRLGF